MRIRQWIAVASGMVVVGGLVLSQASADAADVAGVQNIVVTDTTARANDIKVENGGLSGGFSYRITDFADGLAVSDGSCSGSPVSVVCGPYADRRSITLRLGPGDDKVQAGILDVVSLVVFGDAGADNVVGGDEVDEVHGGDGDDYVDTESGNDFVYGDAGNDTLYGGPLGDVADGGDGDDYVDGEGGFDTLHGGAGADHLVGGATSPFAVSGNDTLQGGPGVDTLDGGEGSLTDPVEDDIVDYSDMQVPVNVDLTAGTGGPAGELDTLIHMESVRGGSADDTLRGNDESNDLSGGPGKDTADYSRGLAVCTSDPVCDFRVSISLDDMPNDRDSDGQMDNVHSDVENLIGTPYDDTLTGSAVPNRLDGRSGSDTISGAGGDDVLIGATSEFNAVYQLDRRDSLSGGPGADTADYSVRTIPVTVSLDGVQDDGAADERDNVGADVENVITGSGNDVITGNASDNFFEGNAGADTFDGGDGNDYMIGFGDAEVDRDQGDILNGGAGVDTADYSEANTPVDLSPDGQSDNGRYGADSEFDTIGTDVENLVGGSARDVLLGSAASNTLVGNGGDDIIDGHGGPDVVAGGLGNDRIFADDGVADRVDCGVGNDYARVDRLDGDATSLATCESRDVGISGVSTAAQPSVTTDLENNGATPDHPVEVTVTSPNPGTDLQIIETSTANPPPEFRVIGPVVRIDASPGSTSDKPFVLVFRIDASVVPAGGVQAITVFRDGVSVAACNASPPRPAGTADPDPCVSSRVPLSDGDAQITVLTSKLSDWAVAHDVVAPTVALVRPARGEAFTINQSAAASYSCADEGSGVSSCTGAVADGAPIPTSQAGFNTFTVTATDAAGNATTVSHQYQVLYPFAGFFSPLENPGHIEGLLNEVKAGASVPLKFSLSGHRGLGIWAQQPGTQRIACDSTAPVDAVEETVTSTSSLTYNASTDTYSYVLKTDKSWAGTCRRATLTLLDGSKHSADFLFR